MVEILPLSHKVCAFMRDFETLRVKSRNQFKCITEKLLLYQNYVTSEGAVSHNVLHCQLLLVPSKFLC